MPVARRLDLMLLLALLGVAVLAAVMAVPLIWPEIAAFDGKEPPAVVRKQPPVPPPDRPQRVCEVRGENQ
jgi:hypothetical protein